MPKYRYTKVVNEPPVFKIPVANLKSYSSKIESGALIAYVDNRVVCSQISKDLYDHIENWKLAELNDSVGLQPPNTRNCYLGHIYIDGFQKDFPILIEKSIEFREKQAIILGRDFINNFVLILGLQGRRVNGVNLYYIIERR